MSLSDEQTELSASSTDRSRAHLPLVLLHGTSGQVEDWSHVIKELSQHRLVMRPNYQTPDESTRPIRDLADLAGNVIQYTEEKAIGRFDLVGYSLGAPVSVYVAANYPEKVRSLVLISGFGNGADSRMRLQFELWSHLTRTDKPTFIKLLVLFGTSSEFVAKLSENAIQQLVDAVMATANWPEIEQTINIDLTVNVLDLAAAIKCPTLSIVAKYDEVVLPHYSRELAKRIPDIREREVSSGHLSFLETPFELASAIGKFLDKQQSLIS